MFCTELQGRENKFRIVAGCDTIRKRRDQFEQEYGCKTYSRAQDLVLDPEVELVGVATRSIDHVPHAILALKAGKDVFIEKPIAASYEGAKKLLAAARRAKGTLYVRHNRRFEPTFQQIRELMASGILGDVFEIKLRRNQFGRRGDWQTLIEYGGGQLLNWGPHIIDHGLRLLESPLAELWSDLKLVAALGDAEDHLKIVMKGKNGRVVDLEISGGSAVEEPEYIVLGTRGGLSATSDSIQLKYLDPRQKLRRLKARCGTPGTKAGALPTESLRWIEKTIQAKPKLGCDMPGIWDYLYDSIRNRKPFPIKLDEALEVMRVVSIVKKGTQFEGNKGL